MQIQETKLYTNQDNVYTSVAHHILNYVNSVDNHLLDAYEGLRLLKVMF